MAETPHSEQRRVLIVSSHPLFGQGLRSLLQQRPEADVHVVGIVSSVEQAIAALNTAQPDLVIVDYDDERVNRDEFLARFVEGERRLRVVLLSLKEGGSEAIVYDRRTLAASQIDDWLEEWSYWKKPQEFIRNIIRPGGKTDPRSSSMKHLFFAALLVIALTALVGFGLSQAKLLPVEASLQAKPIDALFRLEFWAIAFLFSLIVGLMLYSIVVFRRRKGDETDAPHIEGNTNLEVIWTLAPLAVVIYLSVIGASTLAATQRADPKPLVVNVIGSQWSWRFDYPDAGIGSTELVLPVNKQVRLRLHSLDVIHSFWVPEFRVKQDLLPGGESMIRELRVTPDLEGNYKVRCAEMCGRLHASMEAPVRVVSQASYDAWIAEQQASIPADPIGRGQKWARQFGCQACHTTNGTVLVGPSWQGIYGKEVTFTDGTTATVDDAYIRESILQPNAHIVKGFQPLMPSLGSQLTEDQINDIIEFIKSLR